MPRERWPLLDGHRSTVARLTRGKIAVDHSSFDRIARLLGGAASRRTGFKALGALLAFGAVDADARKRARPGKEGPCGNGKRKANSCKKNSDCCTGICNTKLGRKNRDGKGRCRCLQKGTACTVSKNCCNSMSCTSGVCGNTPAPGPTCSCSACADACVPTVGPGLAFATIQGAIDKANPGDTIMIAPGKYDEDVFIAMNLKLRGCPGTSPTDVPVVTNATYGSRTITIIGMSTVEIVDLIIDGYNDADAQQGGGGIGSDGTLSLCHNTVVRNGLAPDGRGGGVRMTQHGGSEHTLFVLDQVVIRDNATDSYGYGGGIHIESGGTAEIRGAVQILDNSAGTGGGIAYDASNKVQVISGQVLIDGNEATGSRGGGIYANGDGTGGFDLRISGKVRITGNRTPGGIEGFGAGIAGFSEAVTGLDSITLSGSVEISGNTMADSYGSGGGIHLNEMYLTATDNVKITGNSATYAGGGISVKWAAPDPTLPYAIDLSGAVAITGNTGTDDYGTDRGGGISSINGAVRIQGTVSIANNTATRGGGIYIDGAPLASTGAVIIAGNRVPVDGDGEGGGIYLKNTNTASTIGGATVISGNRATYGGGIYLLGESVNCPLTFATTASVKGNAADLTTNSGGGVYIDGQPANAIITNGQVVTGNTPDQCSPAASCA
jgi:predicted outer membrane repeat protein